jgi:hypothetical protein
MGPVGRVLLERILRLYRVGHPGRRHLYPIRHQEDQTQAGDAHRRPLCHRGQPDSVSRDEGDAQRNTSTDSLSAPGPASPLPATATTLPAPSRHIP